MVCCLGCFFVCFTLPGLLNLPQTKPRGDVNKCSIMKYGRTTDSYQLMPEKACSTSFSLSLLLLRCVQGSTSEVQSWELLQMSAWCRSDLLQTGLPLSTRRFSPRCSETRRTQTQNTYNTTSTSLYINTYHHIFKTCPTALGKQTERCTLLEGRDLSRHKLLSNVNSQLNASQAYLFPRTTLFSLHGLTDRW